MVDQRDNNIKPSITKNNDSNDLKKIKTLNDHEIILSSEFESGNGIEFQKHDKIIYSFKPERDSGENYSGQPYYFKFSAENLTEINKSFTVTAIADYDDVWQGWRPAINTKLWKFTSNSMSHLNPKKVKATPYSMGINVDLLPKQKIFISDMLVVPYSEMLEILNEIQEVYPTFIKLKEIGNTPMGNKIISIKINPESTHWNDQNKPKIVISGTPQSNEFGDYASIMVLRKFIKKGADFWDNFHKDFRLEFIFFQNADGIVLGKNMVNSKGKNIFFSFFNEKEFMPEENRIIWEYLSQEPPNLYLEYHSYFQDLKTIRPYLYPNSLLKSKDLRKTYKKLSSALKSYSNGAKEEIKIDQPDFSNTLAYRLQETFQTMSFQYKLHSCMELEENEDVAWKIFTKLTNKLKKSLKKDKKS